MADAESEALKADLAHQAALQRETEHRIKNTLQLISSIVMLQGRRAAEEPARRALQALLQRIQAVSVAHRRVAREDGREVVELSGLIRELASDLASSAGRDGVAIDLDLEPVLAPAKDGAPVALVASEALTNALRHAFPDGRSGRVRVSLRAEGGGYLLSVADDGVGPGEGGKGFGSMVLQLMVQQLRGRLDTQPTQPGLKLSVSVPMNPQASPRA